MFSSTRSLICLTSLKNKLYLMSQLSHVYIEKNHREVVSGEFVLDVGGRKERLHARNQDIRELMGSAAAPD